MSQEAAQVILGGRLRGNQHLERQLRKRHGEIRIFLAALRFDELSRRFQLLDGGLEISRPEVPRTQIHSGLRGVRRGRGSLLAAPLHWRGNGALRRVVANLLEA